MTPSRSAATILHRMGWQFEGEPPSIPKYVCLAAPHTSNWDGLLLLLAGRSVGLPMAWMIKDAWVKGPMAPLMRRLGAVAIDRSRANNLVQKMANEFAQRDRFVLVIPPEGTRARTDYWKSGFYNIARTAKVPVVCGYLDYARRRAGLGEPILLTGDLRHDMDRIRAFYQKQAPAPCHPHDFGPIRLRGEEAVD